MWRSFAHTMLVLPAEVKARAWADFHNPLSLASPAPAHPDTMPLVEEVTPTGMGEWTRVAFQSYRDGNWEIYTAGGDGSHLTRLTNHAGSDGLPSFDRAAAQVAFAGPPGSRRTARPSPTCATAMTTSISTWPIRTARIPPGSPIMKCRMLIRPGRLMGRSWFG